MTLSYLKDPFSAKPTRTSVRVTLTTEHSASSDGQPVLVLPDGEALDLLSWVGCGYRVEQATDQEREALNWLLGRLVG